jgi:hypothetical protein
MNKISKKEAKRLFLAGFPVWFCPSKCYSNIGHPFNCAYLLQCPNDEEDRMGCFARSYNSFRYYNCNKETGSGVAFYIDYQKPAPIIEFTADHCQYFVGRPSRDGHFGPFIGPGSDEAEAYSDAIAQAFENPESEHVAQILPKRAGNAKRGLNYWFGKGTAREIAKNGGDFDLYVYCIIYLPKPQQI